MKNSWRFTSTDHESNSFSLLHEFEEKDAIENFVNWCYKGPPGTIVRKIEKVHGKTEDFREFRVLY